MDYASNMSAPAYPKRPGSPMAEHAMPAAKMSRTVGSSQLQINYLVRQKQDVLPLVTTEEKMPRVLQLISEYDGVLQRHESMAGNLGACPVGPILLKRFERLFEGPPRVLKSHAKDPSVTWLDVVEFAQNRPEQFNLEKQRNGVRVCQFYHKQCRVEISEEDYVLIASGMPQKLIPPQPILEDEEKELGIMEILERNLAKLTQMADQISARARQLNHKLKQRRSAIMSRREAEADPRKSVLASNDTPTSPIDLASIVGKPMRSIETSQSPPLGFTAVNNKASRPSHHGESASGSGGWEGMHTSKVIEPDDFTSPAKQTFDDLSASSNGIPGNRRDSDMSKFLTESERRAGMTEDTIRRQSLPQSVPPSTPDENTRQEHNFGYPTAGRKTLGGMLGRDYHKLMTANVSAGGSDAGSPSVAIPSTPSSLLPHSKPNVFAKDDGGPFKAEMVARMENMARGERVIPPCDRCRRLQMDCMKNLTACQGCTKKHAKCSWKDVVAEELIETGGGQIHDRNNTTAMEPDTLHNKSASAEPHPHAWSPLLSGKERTTHRDTDAMQIDPITTQGDTIEAHPFSSRKQSHAGSPNLSTTTPRSHPTADHSRSHSPKLDVRPPPLEQQSKDATNGRGQAQASSRSSATAASHTQRISHVQGQYTTNTAPGQHNETYKPTRTSAGHTRAHKTGVSSSSELDHDESDRLQELARQVYRSASQGVKPGSL